jgi:hypothetical protein
MSYIYIYIHNVILLSHKEGNCRISFLVKLAKLRGPKATCSLSYVEYRPNTNATIIL